MALTRTLVVCLLLSTLTGAFALDCFRTGCSGTICSHEEVMTTCLAPSQEETCKVTTSSCTELSDGTCGWTVNKEYLDCLPSACKCQGFAPLAPVSRCPGIDALSGYFCLPDGDACEWAQTRCPANVLAGNNWARNVEGDDQDDGPNPDCDDDDIECGFNLSLSPSSLLNWYLRYNGRTSEITMSSSPIGKSTIAGSDVISDDDFGDGDVEFHVHGAASSLAVSVPLLALSLIALALLF